MPDKRPVDDLSIEELEDVLRRRKRERQEERLRRYRESGRARGDVPLPAPVPGGRVPKTAAVPASPARQWTNRVLLGVEIAALFGFLYVIYLLGTAIQSTNLTPAAASGVGTATATPLIDVALLPDSHQPPNAAGESSPNEAGRIPEHLQSVVARTTPLPVPTAGPEQARTIEIPAISVRAQVVEGDGWEQLKKGVGHHPGTANPGQKGNLVLAGHNDVFGEVFRDLNKLKAGDLIIVETATQRYTYTVAGWRIVEPTDVNVMYPTQEPTITLISCWPYLQDTQRIVVNGTLVK